MIKTETETKKPDRFDNIITKYKARGLSIVADFLLTKARKSKRTAIAFSFGLDYLNKFIEQNYNNNNNGYNIQTILPVLKKQKLDVYNLLNSFVSYLQNDTVNGHDLTPRSVNAYMVAVKIFCI
jgi:hypothetical protein